MINIKEIIKPVQFNNTIPFIALTKELTGNFEITEKSEAKLYNLRLKKSGLYGCFHISPVLPSKEAGREKLKLSTENLRTLAKIFEILKKKARPETNLPEIEKKKDFDNRERKEVRDLIDQGLDNGWFDSIPGQLIEDLLNSLRIT